MIDHCDKPEITINLHEINLMKSIFHSFSHNTCFSIDNYYIRFN